LTLAVCPSEVPLDVVRTASTGTSPAAIAVTCSLTLVRLFAPILSGPVCWSIRSLGWPGFKVR
jgi:hypothetical protein